VRYDEEKSWKKKVFEKKDKNTSSILRKGKEKKKQLMRKEGANRRRRRSPKPRRRRGDFLSFHRENEGRELAEEKKVAMPHAFGKEEDKRRTPKVNNCFHKARFRLKEGGV